jgi:hypothetical protein
VLINGLALAVLLSLMGIVGAVIALAIAHLSDKLLSAFVVRRLDGVPEPRLWVR